MKYLGSIPPKKHVLSFPDDPFRVKNVPREFPRKITRSVHYFRPTTLTSFHISIPLTLNTKDLVDQSVDCLEAFRVNGPSDMELKLTEANDDSLSARMTELFKSLTPDMTIDKAYQLQEESEKKMKTLGRDDWREEIRRVFPSTFKTIHSRPAMCV